MRVACDFKSLKDLRSTCTYVKSFWNGQGPCQFVIRVWGGLGLGPTFELRAYYVVLRTMKIETKKPKEEKRTKYVSTIQYFQNTIHNTILICNSGTMKTIDAIVFLTSEYNTYITIS